MRKLSLVFFSIFLLSLSLRAQLNTTPFATADALAQSLVGSGVTITNVRFTGLPEMAASFSTQQPFIMGINKGILLTTGAASKANRANNSMATTFLNLPGDADMASQIGIPVSETHDACVLEFDFVPMGDSIKFNYILASEEYDPFFVCRFNDGFGFFISGPGINGLQNIALVPGTSTVVSITNVNNVQEADCPDNTEYYIDNTAAPTAFVYEGLLKVLTAQAKVQPCQTYHIKLVITDVLDQALDSGVFLEAGSFSSNAISVTNLTPVDPVSGVSFIAEGCQAGRVQIKRKNAATAPLTIQLSYGGNALNNVDVAPLPPFVVIPANDSVAFLDVTAIADNLAEGTEDLWIFTTVSCQPGITSKSDSTLIQLRDFDDLNITPVTSVLCRNETIQLNAKEGFATYSWNDEPVISDRSVRNPFVKPARDFTIYSAIAINGNCIAKDSAFVQLKTIDSVSQKNVICAEGTNGMATIGLGSGWQHPVLMTIDNGPSQTDSVFSNLSAGIHIIRVVDATGCRDSILFNIGQSVTDLAISDLITSPANCSQTGKITVQATGGLAPYLFSVNGGVSFQPGNEFNVSAGNFQVLIKDQNGCISPLQNAVVDFTGDLAITAGNDIEICEGASARLQATGAADTFTWSPSMHLSNETGATTTASPTTTQQYIVTAVKGTCKTTDTVTVRVNPTPVADAGRDLTVCFREKAQLQAAGNFSTFTWSPAADLNDPTLPNPSTTRLTGNTQFLLTVKDARGCSSVKPDTVVVKVVPQVVVHAGRDTSVIIDQPFQLHAVDVNNSGITQWQWNPANLFISSTAQHPTLRVQAPSTTIRLRGTTAEGCTDEHSIVVKAFKEPAIFVPSGFTPNKDGLNEEFKAFGVGIRQLDYFAVYNRWGERVFFSKDFAKGWDGRYKGVLQPAGVFVWMLQAVDITGKVHAKKGTLILIL